MYDNFLISLEIMMKGMGGIFAACLIIMAAVWIMGKISSKK
jgi:Na+-transporting methylmalonyl-CoA/oxaloacetate decarboxylase gamma subunit